MGKRGMLEEWGSGILGSELQIFLTLFHYSTVPTFHCS